MSFSSRPTMNWSLRMTWFIRFYLGLFKIITGLSVNLQLRLS
jgi:hypothetical protein